MNDLLILYLYGLSDFCLQRVKKVIGIELCQEAVEDAKVNAKLNGRTLDNITQSEMKIL